MKRCRFLRPTSSSDGSPLPETGVVEGERVLASDGASFRLEDIELLAPSEPTKIVAVGVNYRAHAAELGRKIPEEPLLFLKPPSAVCPPGGVIRLPRMSDLVHHEAELALVIGRRARNISPDDARAAIAGYTCLNDVTARDLQRKDTQFTRAKSFDTFAPVGPWLETDLDPSDLAISCRVNGQERQSGRTSDMIWGVFALVSFISRVMTLEPGDVVTTGTPVGVGPLADGDRVEVEVEGVGILLNRCEAER